ncbi:peptidase inhibitor family I36 protein [Streptomyces sp. NPDC088551]|uniref:peptidase inhibitor family I36 protein n=1 Tax=Streptomyces sp. NPDC088551 TaxID=3365863 RepID=UPI003818665E
MRTLVKALLVAGAAASLVTGANPAVAAAAPACTSNLCYWTGTNYTGSKVTSGLNSGVCYHGTRVRSVENPHDIQVRYYPNISCTGVPYFTSQRSFTDIDAQSGFAVWSYKRI